MTLHIYCSDCDWIAASDMDDLRRIVDEACGWDDGEDEDWTLLDDDAELAVWVEHEDDAPAGFDWRPSATAPWAGQAVGTCAQWATLAAARGGDDYDTRLVCSTEW